MPSPWWKASSSVCAIIHQQILLHSHLNERITKSASHPLSLRVHPNRLHPGKAGRNYSAEHLFLKTCFAVRTDCRHERAPCASFRFLGIWATPEVISWPHLTAPSLTRLFHSTFHSLTEVWFQVSRWGAWLEGKHVSPTYRLWLHHYICCSIKSDMMWTRPSDGLLCILSCACIC